MSRYRGQSSSSDHVIFGNYPYPNGAGDEGIDEYESVTIVVNKRTHLVGFEDETENEVTVTIRPRQPRPIDPDE